MIFTTGHRFESNLVELLKGGGGAGGGGVGGGGGGGGGEGGGNERVSDADELEDGTAFLNDQGDTVNGDIDKHGSKKVLIFHPQNIKYLKINETRNCLFTCQILVPIGFFASSCAASRNGFM